jgi:hypothetical protein
MHWFDKPRLMQRLHGRWLSVPVSKGLDKMFQGREALKIVVSTYRRIDELACTERTPGGRV